MKNILQKNWFKNIKQSLTSKDWWKKQYKMRNWMWLLYGLWIVYGTWLLMKVLTYMIFEIPVTRADVVGSAMIAFIWFVFYIINEIGHKSTMKWMWKLIDIYKENNELIRHSHEKALKGWEETHRELMALSDKVIADEQENRHGN